MVKKNNPEKPETEERLSLDHFFKFECEPGISCFTTCCQDITIVLTPYDVLRMKNALGISSDAFIDKYTLIIPKKNRLLPMVTSKMNEDDKKCPFVKADGCTIYSDRPWPCRMYPLDMADDGSFHIISNSAKCHGLKRPNPQKVEDWLTSQEIAQYDEMNDLLSHITYTLNSEEYRDITNPKISQMIFMALYNLDKFKRFIFESSFLKRLYVEPERIQKIQEDDIELLKFAYDWIKFGIFGEKLFWVKDQDSDSLQD